MFGIMYGEDVMSCLSTGISQIDFSRQQPGMTGDIGSAGLAANSAVKFDPQGIAVPCAHRNRRSISCQRSTHPCFYRLKPKSGISQNRFQVGNPGLQHTTC